MKYYYMQQTMHPMEGWEHFPIMVLDIADEFRQLNKFTTRLICYIRYAISYQQLPEVE